MLVVWNIVNDYTFFRFNRINFQNAYNSSSNFDLVLINMSQTLWKKGRIVFSCPKKKRINFSNTDMCRCDKTQVLTCRDYCSPCAHRCCNFDFVPTLRFYLLHFHICCSQHHRRCRFKFVDSRKQFHYACSANIRIV